MTTSAICASDALTSCIKWSRSATVGKVEPSPARAVMPVRRNPDSPDVRLSPALRCLVRAACAAACLTVCLGTTGPAALAQAFRPTPEIQAIAPVVAPSLEGGVEWLNTSGPLSLAQLRGKIVILDFWTYCCINCLQTLPDLRRLEEEYANQLVVVGVHAPKFVGERDSANVREAILRYEVGHPVVNDANALIARKYAVTGWPSLRVIDPTGSIIARHDGEATFEALSAFIKRTVAKYRRSGALDESPLRFALERNEVKPTPLRFPGKVLADPTSQRLFIADSGHHRIVITSLDGRLLGTIGSGAIGRDDGPAANASFSSPQGIALAGETLLVADTENHLVRQVDLTSGTVTTIAGTGEQAPGIIVRATSRPTGIPLASPWDLQIVDDELYIAMAGAHQIWRKQLNGKRLHTYAGNGAEDIVDGSVLPRTAFQQGSACFAQPSGLATDGQVLFVADSEGSSIRAVPLGGRGQVSTILGTAGLPQAVRLFTFGDRDGPLSQAMLQHPLAVAYGNDRLWLADTYNNKIKEIDLTEGTIRTLAGDGQAGVSDEPPRFNEPAGLSLAGDTLFVADTNNHAIRRINLSREGGVSTLKILGLKPPVVPERQDPPIPPGRKISFAATSINGQRNELPVSLQVDLPPGWKLSPDISMTFVARVTGGDKILASDTDGKRRNIQPAADGPRLALPLARRTGSATLEVTLAYFYCSEESQAICKMATVTWNGDIRLTEAGDDEPLLLKYQPSYREIESRR